MPAGLCAAAVMILAAADAMTANALSVGAMIAKMMVLTFQTLNMTWVIDHE